MTLMSLMTIMTLMTCLLCLLSLLCFVHLLLCSIFFNFNGFRICDLQSCYDARDAIASKNDTESEFLWNILQTSKSWQFSMTWFLSILNILHDFNGFNPLNLDNFPWTFRMAFSMDFFQWTFSMVFFNGLFLWTFWMDFSRIIS